MEALGLFLLACLIALVTTLIQGFIGWFLLDSTFHLGFAVWWGIAIFLGLFTQVRSRD